MTIPYGCMVNQYKVKLRTLFEFLVQQEHFMAEYNGYDLAPFHRVADPRSTYPQSLRYLIFRCHKSQPERLSWNPVHQEFRTRDAKDSFLEKSLDRLQN